MVNEHIVYKIESRDGSIEVSCKNNSHLIHVVPGLMGGGSIFIPMACLQEFFEVAQKNGWIVNGGETEA